MCVYVIYIEQCTNDTIYIVSVSIRFKSGRWKEWETSEICLSHCF